MRTGQKEVASYLKEKAPEWKENLSNAKDSAAGALQAGTRELASRLSSMKDRLKRK